MSPEMESATTDPELSLRDTIAAAFAADTSEAQPTIVEDAPEVSAEQPAAARARDETGRFAAKPEAPPESTVAAPTDKPDAAPSPIEAPKSWNAEARDLFVKADPALREYIARRDREQSEGVAKLKQSYEGRARFADEIWSEIAPHAQAIQSEGATPATAIRSLLQDAHILRTGTPEQRAHLFMERAAQFGVDLSQLASLPPPQRPDPRLTAVQQELASVKSFLEQSQQAAAQQQRAELVGKVENFKSDKPHFEEVRHMMGVLIESGQAQDLQDAYEMAVYANPTIRTKLLAEQQAKAAKENAGKARQVAGQARAKAVSVTGAPGGSSAATAPPDDLRALIAQQVYGEGRA